MQIEPRVLIVSMAMGRSKRIYVEAGKNVT